MLHTGATLVTGNRSIYIIKYKTSQKCFSSAVELRVWYEHCNS